MADLPFHDLVRGFLQNAAQDGMETVVWAVPRGAVGGAVREMFASNHPDAPAKARARLLVEDGAIENVAKAIHTFRFTEPGKPVDPSMDFCSFLPCAGAIAETLDRQHASVGSVPWEKLPEDAKELHRTFAKVLLAALAQKSQEQVKKSSIIV